MLLVHGAIEKRDGPAASLSRQIDEHLALRRSLQFSAIPTAKLFPFGRIVPKPFSERYAGRRFFEPERNPRPLFSYPSRPQPIHEDSEAVSSARRAVDAFQPDHIESKPRDCRFDFSDHQISQFYEPEAKPEAGATTPAGAASLGSGTSRAHRNPSQFILTVGSAPFRCAARTAGVLSIHPPPRKAF